MARLGELIGYGLRLGTGYLSDRTRQYWGITTLSYFINTAVVPLLSFAERWEVAGGLMIAERTGKAIRYCSLCYDGSGGNRNGYNLHHTQR